MKLKLRFKIILLVSTALIITTGIVSFTTIARFTNNTQDLVTSKVQDLSSSTSREVKAKIEEIQTFVNLIASSENVTTFLAGENHTSDEIQQYLSSTYENNQNLLESLVLVDANKTGIMTNSAKDLSLDLTARDYLKLADTGVTAVSEPIDSSLTSNKVIAIAAPINHKGTHVGYLIAAVPFSQIQDIIDSIQVFDHGYAYLFDKSGLVLSHPTKDYLYSLNVGDQDSETLNTMIKDINAGKSNTAIYTFGGEEKLVSYEAVGSWGLAVTANKSDYMKTTIETTELAILIAVVLTLIIVVLVSLYISMFIVNPIVKIQKLMLEAGNGDLTLRSQIKNTDEIGDISNSFNQMIDSQKSTLEIAQNSSKSLESATLEISESSMQVSESSMMIATNASQLAEVAMEQNDSVSEASQFILQLSSLIELAKVSAVSASNNIKESLEVAELGRTNVGTTIDAINNIKNNSIETNESLSNVAALSEQISGVVETINNIAAQTNLLALNASIEAARAGENGKGFSVVAEEVRKLAEQTGAEANQISSVVSKMTSSISVVVSSMDNNNESVDLGVVRAHDVDKSFVDILNTFERVMDNIVKIEDITKDEVVSSDEIIKTIEYIGQLSDKNSGSAQDIAAAVEEQTALLENITAQSEEISSMAEELNKTVEVFKLD